MVLLPTGYFPPISYLAACRETQVVTIEQWETYPKQTLRNHCRIYGPNGPIKLTVPVSKPNGNHTLTRDILISEHEAWQKIHWRTLESAYNKSPFFLYYKDHFTSFFEERQGSLLLMNLRILEVVFRLLRWEKEVVLTGSFQGGGLPEFEDGPLEQLPERLLFLPEYVQVFSSRLGFNPNLSILDLIFNLGPEAGIYLDHLSNFHTE